MTPEQIKQLEKLAKVFNTSNVISPEDVKQVVEGIAQVLKVEREKIKGLSEEHKQTLENTINIVSKELDKVLSKVENTSQNAISEATEAVKKISDKLEEVKRLANEVMEMKPENGKDGMDADEEKIIEEVLSKIKLPENKEFLLTGEDIVDNINALSVTPENQIDASHIKNLPTPIIQGSNISKSVYQLEDVKLSSLTNNDVLKYNSTTKQWENGTGGGGATAFTDLTDVPSSYSGQGGKAVRVNVGETGLEFFTASGSGTVTSVAATVPTGLTISGSPITAAGTLAIGLDTGYVIPLQSTIDGKANTALSNLASVAINTSLISDTDNTDDLGSALIGWRTGYFSTSILTPKVTADTSGGLLLEASNGTDVGLLGAGNTANVEWYGSHNFDTATQDTIAAFTGAGKTLGSLSTATYPSLTELSYVKGVTSAIQTQLNAKVDDGAVTTSGLTMSTARILGRTTASTGAIEELSTVDSFVSAASDTTAGKIEVATTAETNTGTDATRAVSPDGLAGSYAGTKSVSIAVFAPTTDVATGDGKAYITIPEALNGMDLIRAQATVVTAGTTNATTVMIHNVTDAVDMLSGAISIASGGTVGTVGTINTSNDGVATNDVLRVDVDSVSTTAPRGLMIVLEFRLP